LSNKGERNENNAKCLFAFFFWPKLEQQVRFEGEIEKLSREESRKKYFHSRPHGSQIGAMFLLKVG
jgi:pyridoxine/pyridoxamine 5'-phosphate oxidase